MLLRLSILGSNQLARDSLPLRGAAAPLTSAPEPDELLLSCTSVFSMKDRGLFGTSVLVVEPALMDGARRDDCSIVGWELVRGPGGDNGPRPPRAASPSVADCDLNLAGFMGPTPKNIEREQAALQIRMLILGTYQIQVRICQGVCESSWVCIRQVQGILPATCRHR